MKYTVIGKHPSLPIFVSIDGEIWSSETRVNSTKWRKYETSYLHGSYRRATVGTKGKLVTCLLHRAVYETFVGVIPKGLECDHINDIPDDNRLENLQLLTPSENTAKTYVNRTSEQYGNAGLSLKKAQELYDYAQTLRDRFGYIKGHRVILADKFNVSKSTVTRILKGTTYKEIDRRNTCGL